MSLPGLTAAAVVVARAMAFATITGLPVQVDLYAAFLPMIIYAVLGTSRALSVSTTTTIAILTATQLGEAVPNGEATLLLEARARPRFRCVRSFLTIPTLRECSPMI